MLQAARFSDITFGHLWCPRNAKGLSVPFTPVRHTTYYSSHTLKTEEKKRWCATSPSGAGYGD